MTVVRGRVSVALVGAGPGDPNLLTLRALELLRAADVVLCDRLVSDAVRARIPATARIIDVGKSRGAGTSQAAIVRMLLREARAGRRVVRLKGGDPFVFGRGGEEALALREAGFEVEIVPGISAALAAPALAGIPVTHRGLATSVCILTAEELRGARTDWRAAAEADTIVLLMGVSGLAEATAALIEAGKDPATPAAIVADAALPTQRVLRASLRTLAARATKARIAPPATVVIGPTAALEVATRREVAAAPLHGRRLLVTRAGHQADALAERIRAAGGEPVIAPAIRIVAGPAAPMRHGLDALERGELDWIVCTSANGVDALFDALAARGLDARTFAGASIATIGPATADRMRAHGIEPELIARPATGAGLARMFPRGAGSALLPRADLADPGLADAIRRKGWHAIEVVAYRIVDAPRWPQSIVRAISDGRIDLVLFASAATAQATARQLARARLDPATLPAVCIGEMCSAGTEAAGFPVAAIAKEPSLDALVVASARVAARQPTRR